MRYDFYPLMFIAGLLLFGLFVLDCTEEKGIYKNKVTQEDYAYLVKELKHFNLPESTIRNSTIVYKSVANRYNGTNEGINLYVLRVKEIRKSELIETLERSKTLVKGNLADDILFAMKAGDKEAFNIDVLQSKRKEMELYTVNELKEPEKFFSTRDLYFHYQRFRVYEDPSKVNLLERRKKFIMFELAKNRILYYNCFYKYQ